MEQNSRLLAYASILTLFTICFVFVQSHLLSRGRNQECQNEDIIKKHKILNDLELKSKNPNQCLQELEIEFPPELIVHPMGRILDLHLVQDEPKGRGAHYDMDFDG